MLTSIYQIVAHYGPQAAYNYWAILGLDIFNLVMWLTAFALLASEVAPYLSAGSTTCNYLGRCTKTALTGERLTLAATQMTAAALGGVELYVNLAPDGIPMPLYIQLTLPPPASCTSPPSSSTRSASTAIAPPAYTACPPPPTPAPASHPQPASPAGCPPTSNTSSPSPPTCNTPSSKCTPRPA